MNTRIAYIALGTFTILVVLLAYLLFRPGSILISSFPSDATITVNGKPYSEGKQISLSAGNKTIVLQRTGFFEKTITAKVKAGETTHLNVTMNVDPQFLANGGQLNLDAADTARGEGLLGNEIESKGQIITKDNPIIQLLPYIGSNFRVDYGVSQKNPDSDAQALYITAPTAAGRQAALDWIRSQGYDPAKLEIIYQ